MALKDMFGGGHYGKVKAHTDRWQAFVKPASLRMGLASMMRTGLIGRFWPIMRRPFVARLSGVKFRT